MEQFEDILRTFIKEANKYENRFGKIRDEEKPLAVKTLMPESLLNHRFRGTTMTYHEMITALDNIILHKVMTTPVAKPRKRDTSGPMDIGMTAKDDASGSKSEVEARITRKKMHQSESRRCRFVD